MTKNRFEKLREHLHCYKCGDSELQISDGLICCVSNNHPIMAVQEKEGVEWLDEQERIQWLRKKLAEYQTEIFTNGGPLDYTDRVIEFVEWVEMPDD